MCSYSFTWTISDSSKTWMSYRVEKRKVMQQPLVLMKSHSEASRNNCIDCQPRFMDG